LGSAEEVLDIHAERVGDPGENLDRGIAFPVLHAAEVGLMDVRAMCELFLREALSVP
jgi:hypothetical protein